MSADDLSGRWAGIFNYPRLMPATSFTAELRDHGGALTGETTELRHDGQATLHALVEGWRDGLGVNFVKFYDALDGEHDRVSYQGSVDAAGQEITGRWTIPGVWSSSFLMVRETGAREAVEDRVGETVGRD